MFLLFAMIVQDPHAQVEGSMKAQLVREIRRFPLLIVESRTGREYLSSITEIANAVPRFSLFQRKKFRLIRLYKQEMIKKKKRWKQLKQWYVRMDLNLTSLDMKVWSSLTGAPDHQGLGLDTDQVIILTHQAILYLNPNWSAFYTILISDRFCWLKYQDQISLWQKFSGWSAAVLSLQELFSPGKGDL